jgi:uncharacterized membrane protein YraQ (UPF0718 family)
MNSGLLIVGPLALLAFLFALRQGVPTARRALLESRDGMLKVLPMMMVAMPMAAFLSELIPSGIAGEWLGADSGLMGLMVAGLAGGLIPGGPFVSFPLVLTFLKAGAGPAQMVALITGWAILAFHRMIAWELPVLGLRFVVIRLASSIILPLLAGLLAQLLLPFFVPFRAMP